MTSALAWLLALPMQVVRLVRMLLQRLLHIGGHRSTPREHAMAELRRSYPDAPDVWLEVVVRNMSSIRGGARDPAIGDAQGIEPEQAIEVPNLVPVATIVEDESLRTAPSRPVSFSAGRFRLSPAAGAESGVVSPIRARSVARQRPRWRELEAAAAPTRGFPSHDPVPAETQVGRTPNRSPAVTRRPEFSRPKELDVTPVAWNPPSEESAVPDTKPVVAPAVLTDDPWAALPHGNAVHAMPRIAERPAGAESLPWSHVPDADRWPALLPATPLPRNAPVTPLSERIARLRAIQERL